MLTLTVTALLAAAPGYGERLYFSDEAALTAGAVVAGNRDGAGFWYNPAGLAEAEDTRLDVSGSTYGLRYRNVPDALTMLAGEDRLALSPASADVFTSPNVLSLARRMSERWVLGATILITEQDTRSAQTESSGPFLNSTGRLRLDLETNTTVYHAGVAASYRVTPNLNVGGALYGFLQRDRSSLQLGIDLASDTDNTFLFVHQRNSGWRAGLEAALGADWQVNEQWSLGACIRTPRFAFANSSDDVSVTTTPTNYTLDTPMKFELERSAVIAPLRFIAGFRFRPTKRAHVSAEAEAFVPIGLQKDAAFSIAGRVGGSVNLTDVVSLGAGVFAQSSPATAPRGFGEEALATVGGTFGVRTLTVLPLKDRDRPIALSFTLALRYAADIGRVQGLVFDFTDARQVGTTNAAFHELVPYVGSSVRF